MAPPVQEAMRTLLRRQIRALASFFVRLILVAMLTATLVLQFPALRANRWVLDMVSGVLVLWPLWIAVGKNWAWRIALGESYVKEGRGEEAIIALRPLDGIQGLLFDATGEGRRWLAEARQK